MMAENYDESYESMRFDGRQDTYETVLLRLDPTPTLGRLKAFYLRYVYDAKQQAYIERPGVEPMFDQIGVDELMGELHAFISTETILSNLSENDIRRITRDAGERIQEFIWFMWDKYGIDEQLWNRVYSVAVDKIETQLRRAKDGQESKLLSQWFQHKELVSKTARADEEEKPKSGGFGIGALFGGRR